MKLIAFLAVSFILLSFAQAELKGSQSLWEKDVASLFSKVDNKSKIHLAFRSEIGNEDRVRLKCFGPHHYELKVAAQDQSGALYYALQEMGFLFPHPRWTIYPQEHELRKHCGSYFYFRPNFQKRGFHLHLQHPNEWVSGFLQGQDEIARDTIRWLVHNSQNVLQLQMIQSPAPNLGSLLKEAKEWGLFVVLGYSLTSQQQKSANLIPLGSVLTGWQALKILEGRLSSILSRYSFDAINLELGTSEFTSTSAPRTLGWINTVEEILSQQGKQVFVKVHVSQGQTDPVYGNFNFIPGYANPRVGVEVHTVMWYSLEDAYTPVYGRKNFTDLKSFMQVQNSRRPVWYFPETSYWIGMDLDVPLFLTDYLQSRASDLKWAKDQKLSGVVDFTTGQELGYWLMDWTHALMTVGSMDPLIGLKKLGEDPRWWQQYLDYQHNYFSNKQIIQFLVAKNLMDELSTQVPFVHSIHEHSPFNGTVEALMSEALQNYPNSQSVRNTELKMMVEVTKLRLEHALVVQQAWLATRNSVSSAESEVIKNKALHDAQLLRLKAFEDLQIVQFRFSRYPESFVFLKKENPTSYPYGYGWPAVTLHFWQREEDQLRENSKNPFFENIYDPYKIIF